MIEPRSFACSDARPQRFVRTGHTLSPLLLQTFFYFVVPMGIFIIGNSVGFPRGKPAATESRY